MADFIQFVNDKTLIVSDQVFSEETVEQYVEKKLGYKKGKISAFTAVKGTSWEAVIVSQTRH